ncbi:uncharacterized protein LOC143749886 isoform X2 [Siphateles boraxobius]|uniref:uncharacterized protein LOC143749886 isoform X2 n=1 Tax=Siphateles boraxobius TaxID=180520 RepID=UPI004062BC09
MSLLNVKLKRTPVSSPVSCYLLMSVTHHQTRSGQQKSHTAAWRAFYDEGCRTHAAYIHTNTCSCLFKGCGNGDRGGPCVLHGCRVVRDRPV